MRPHTLNSIAEAHGVNKRAVQSWLAKAKAEYGEVGEVIGKTRFLSDAERDMLLQYAGSPRHNPGAARAPEVLPDSFADPFTGVVPGGAILPTGYRATDRSLAVLMSEQRVKQLCDGAAMTNQQTVQAGVHNSINLGRQLGAFLGEQTIQAAEQQRQQMIEQYLRSQGVQTAPKPPGGSPDGNAA